MLSASLPDCTSLLATSNLHSTWLLDSALQQTSALLYSSLMIPLFQSTVLLFVWQCVSFDPLSFLSSVVWFLVLVQIIIKLKRLMHWFHLLSSMMLCYELDFRVSALTPIQLNVIIHKCIFLLFFCSSYVTMILIKILNLHLQFIPIKLYCS